MKLTAGQISDYKGAALLMDAIDALPEARELLADRGYDADWFRDALRARGIRWCRQIISAHNEIHLIRKYARLAAAKA